MNEASISSLRRRAAKLGLRFYKTNWRKDSCDNHGGYQVLDTYTNFVVDGARYDLEFSAVADVIAHREAEAA